MASARRRWAMTLAAPWVGLLLVELVLRITGAERLPNPTRAGSIVGPSSIQGLGFEPRPGLVLELDYGETRPRGQQRVQHRFNAESLRGPVLPVQRQPGHGPRILCIGDSHTFGTGATEDETWPARLAQSLASLGYDRAEVLNAGVPGYDTLQEAIWMKHTGLVYSPDLVLLQYFVNDTAVRDAIRPDEPEPDWIVKLVHPRRGGWTQRARSLSRTVDVALDAIYRTHAMFEHVEQLTRWHAPDDPGWKVVTSALLQARGVAIASGARFAVVLYPILLRDGDGFASRPALERVASFCRQHGIPVFDGEPALLASDIPEELLRMAPGDMHAGSEAHVVFGEAVARWLVSPDSPIDLALWQRPDH
jgi:lysophospholipase L1-like esterase